MGLGGQQHAPATLPTGKAQYPLYRRMGGPQGRSGRVRKISPPPGFDPRTVQPVASRYTDWAIAAHPCRGYVRNQGQETKLLNKPMSPRRLTFTLLTWTKWWPPASASKWRMGFSSAFKGLSEGGAAILQALNRNHHMAILGIKFIKPLLTKRLRLPKRS